MQSGKNMCALYLALLEQNDVNTAFKKAYCASSTIVHLCQSKMELVNDVILGGGVYFVTAI